MTFTASPADNWNSFATVADADSYHTDRANTTWTDFTTAQKQTYLIKATDYIRAFYEFSTDPVGESVDERVIEATVILAYHAITYNLMAVEEARQTTSESKSLSGGLNISASYSLRKNDRFPFVTSLLAPIAAYSPSKGSGPQVGWIVV